MMEQPGQEQEADKIISSAESVSGEIDPSKPDKTRSLREEMAALTKQKEAAAANLAELDAKMEEVKNGPQSEVLRELNLDLLNRLEDQRKGLQERYNDLGRKLAEKKLGLEDLSN